MNNPQDLVAKSGFFTGLHSGMGIAAKVMVVVFVVFVGTVPAFPWRASQAR